MVFKQMNPEDVLKALEGHQNVIKEEVKRVVDYFSNLQCLHCGGSCRMEINNKKLFDSGSILPNFIAQCNDCDAQFTPYTKIEVQGPKRDPLEP